MKWKNNKVVENKGVNFVSEIVSDSKSIFNKIDGSNDVGLDGYIEFTSSEYVTGLCVGIQIKSGNSNLSSDKKRIYLKSDAEHFRYWNGHVLPILGVVYIPEERKGFWVDITEYLRGDSKIIKTGPYNIPIDRNNEFSLEGFDELRLHFQNYINDYSQYWNFGKSLFQFVDDHKIEDRLDALKSLFYYHRNKKEAWFYLIRQFGIEKDSIIQRNLIHLFAHLEGHGDIWWHKDNIINQEIRKYGRALISQLFNSQELKILLSCIDENGITRGSIGQDIHVLFDLVSNKIDKLKNIILDKTTDDDSRSYAGLLAIYEFQKYDMERAINFAKSMIENFPNSEHKDNFIIIKDLLEKGGYVNFYG